MPPLTATAIAHPNIAFIKYWGNKDQALRLPANSSISMNLAALETRTTVQFESALPYDSFKLNGEEQTGAALERVVSFINRVRDLAGIQHPAVVESTNNFPMGAGIASSASAFAALSLAATAAASVTLNQRDLSRLARLGSGSACRSVPGGFVEWQAGDSDINSYAYSIAAPDHWDLVDCIAVVSREEKPVGSTRGNQLADTSPLQPARVADAARRLDICRRAIEERDFTPFAEIVEQDSNMMHSVMLTSRPPLVYWQPATLGIMQAVQEWREHGLNACYTIDAGPNVHVICRGDHAEEVASRLGELEGVQEVLTSPPGGPARLVED